MDFITYAPVFLFIILAFCFLFLWYAIGEECYREAKERQRLAREIETKIHTIGNEINLLRIRQRTIHNKQSRRLDIHLHEESKEIPKGRGKETLIPPRKVQ